MFTSLLNSASGSLSIGNALLCTVASLAFGLLIAYVYGLCGARSRQFLVSLALLPVIVQTVILMVNGNLGAGVAVAGAFSLVRFRSAPGNALDICAVFFAMAIGIATGMGYVTFALLVTVVVLLVLFALTRLRFGENLTSNERHLTLLVPENLDYTQAFTDVFAEYARGVHLDRVKTSHLGSMYELQYHLTLVRPDTEKQMIDALRCRNGNLTITCGEARMDNDTL